MPKTLQTLHREVMVGELTKIGDRDVLTREEKKERRRRDRHFAALDCPNCGRTDIRSEWS